MDYIGVHICLSPFSEEVAEIIEAGIDDLGFDSYSVEEPRLDAFIDNTLEVGPRTVYGSRITRRAAAQNQ